MFMVVVAVLAIAFMVSAFVFKQPMLHGVAMLGWMLVTYLLVRSALTSYPSPSFMPTAAGLFGMSMVIVSVVSILLPYIRSRRGEADLYNQRQFAYREKVAGITRRKVKRWWE